MASRSPMRASAGTPPSNCSTRSPMRCASAASPPKNETGHETRTEMKVSKLDPRLRGGDKAPRGDDNASRGDDNAARGDERPGANGRTDDLRISAVRALIPPQLLLE